MKAMQPVSARALTVASALTVFAGFLVMSPSASFLAFCLATLLAAIPAVFGAGKFRLVSVVVLLTAAGLAAGNYGEFRSGQQSYRQHVNPP